MFGREKRVLGMNNGRKPAGASKARKNRARRSMAPARSKPFGTGGARRMTMDPRAMSMEGRRSVGGRKSFGGRKSLGGRVGGRKSIGGRKSEGARKSAGTRKSAGGRKSSGRASYGTHRKGQFVDPRPFKTREFKIESGKKIIKFLIDNKYDHHITQKMLMQPTSKDYQNIITFLFKCLDHNYILANLRKDVVSIYRGLKYPRTISSTSLVAAGSTAAWPQILAATVWLVELLSYNSVMEEVEEELDDDDEFTDRRFFSFLSEIYRAFLAGDDELCDEIRHELQNNFDQVTLVVENEVEKEEDQLKQLQDGVEDYKQKLTKLPHLRKENGLVTEDIKKFLDFIAQLEKQQAKVAEGVEKAEHVYAEKVSTRDDLLRKKEEMMKVVEQQEVSLDQYQEMISTRNELRLRLKNAHAEKEAQNQQIHAAEMRRSTQAGQVTDSLKEYNTAVCTCQLGPVDGKFANGKVFHAELNTLNPKKPLLSVDLKGDVRPALEDLLTVSGHQYLECRTSRLELKERVDVLEERKSKATATTRSLTHRLTLSEDDFKHRQRTLRQNEEDQQRRGETLQVKNRELRGQNELLGRQLHDTEMLLQKLTTELEQQEAESLQETDRLSKQIISALNKMAAHKENVQKILAGATSQFSQYAKRAEQAINFLPPSLLQQQQE